MGLDAKAGERKIERWIGAYGKWRTPCEITPVEIRPTTVSQVFQNEKVVPIWSERSRSALELGRRRRGSQNHNLIVEIQTVYL